MMRYQRLIVAAALGVVAVASDAAAFPHVSDYQTNLKNYRVCDGSPVGTLGTCDYEDVLSPSLYYLAHGEKGSVVHKAGGTVKVRIDALALDDGVTFSCDDRDYECAGSSGAEICQTGPHEGDGCTPDVCVGGANDGLSCTVPSDCSGGFCSGMACDAKVCLDGPQVDEACVVASECESLADSEGWRVVFSGNEPSFQISFGPPVAVLFLLRGDDPSGCTKTCDFSLDEDGEVNDADLSCTTTGDCFGSNVPSFHFVEIVDPEGDVVAISGIGAAAIVDPTNNTLADGDPAKFGDCNRSPTPSPCP